MTQARDAQARSEIRDGMEIDWDVPVAMDDGIILRADVFRPASEGRFPVLLTYGPYAKGLAFQDGYPDAWETMVREHPDVPAGSTNLYQNWEVVDPEKWVPDGYACVRVDSRGCGRSPGFVNVWSRREALDLRACIEGAADYYRDLARHGGILCTFGRVWFPSQVVRVQHGVGSRGYRSRMTGEWVAGPATLSEEQLGAARSDFYQDCRDNALATDEYWRSRLPDFSNVKVPLLSAANWGGQGLHPRGNFEGFTRAASRDKWLEAHGIEHWTHFYTDYGRELQRKFFDYFL